jgi:hypothetical protein
MGEVDLKADSFKIDSLEIAESCKKDLNGKVRDKNRARSSKFRDLLAGISVVVPSFPQSFFSHVGNFSKACLKTQTLTSSTESSGATFSPYVMAGRTDGCNFLQVALSLDGNCSMKMEVVLIEGRLANIKIILNSEEFLQKVKCIESEIMRIFEKKGVWIKDFSLNCSHDGCNKENYRKSLIDKSEGKSGVLSSYAGNKSNFIPEVHFYRDESLTMVV